MGTVISVVSGKGGTGKTSLVAAVGSCLAAEGKRVLCIDLDVGLRNLDISLGMREIAALSFYDVMEGRSGLSSATAHPDISGLFLLTAPITKEPEDIPPEGLRRLLEEARESFDYCFIDAPAGLGTGFKLAASYADTGIVVSTGDASSLRDAERAAAKLSELGLTQRRLVVNRVVPRLQRKFEETIDDAMDFTGLPLLGLVPEDERVLLSAARNSAMILEGKSPAMLAFLRIARRLDGRRIPLGKF